MSIRTLATAAILSSLSAAGVVATAPAASAVETTTVYLSCTAPTSIEVDGVDAGGFRTEVVRPCGRTEFNFDGRAIFVPAGYDLAQLDSDGKYRVVAEGPDVYHIALSVTTVTFDLARRV